MSARTKSPALRAEGVRISLERKVALLEKFAADGVPAGQRWPRTMKEVAEWTSPEHKLAAWSKPNIVSPAGPYPALRRRLDEALAALVAREAVKGTVRDTAVQIRALVRERDALAAQVVGLLDKIATMERDGRLTKPIPGNGAPRPEGRSGRPIR